MDKTFADLPSKGQKHLKSKYKDYTINSVYFIDYRGSDTSGCGNDWSITTEYKQHAKMMEVAQNLLRWNKNAKSAYLITNYTQKMCEMNASDFGEYVKNNGIRLI